VRQNTPHPKELKAKAHKLFSKDKKDDDGMTPLTEEVSEMALVVSRLRRVVSTVAA
jgi:protein scribble